MSIEHSIYDELIAESEHYLYVVEIVGQCVKVGITRNPKRRINSHRYNAHVHGKQIGQVWVSTPHENARANEYHLMNKFMSSSEYIPVNFDVIVAKAKLLPKHRTLRVKQPTNECTACIWVENHILNAIAVLHELSVGNICLVDDEGNDVTRHWVMIHNKGVKTVSE